MPSLALICVFLGIWLHLSPLERLPTAHKPSENAKNRFRGAPKGNFIHSPRLTPVGFLPNGATQGENSLITLNIPSQGKETF